jgi:hypothetical protein
MPVANVVMLGAGFALALWTTRQHLGRSRGAREWSRAGPGSMAERTTLVVHPLLTAILLLAGIGNDTVEPAGAGAVLWLAVVGCLVVLGAYLVLPLPIPDLLKPRWYREGRTSRAGRP